MDSWPVIRWKHWPTCVESAYIPVAMLFINLGLLAAGTRLPVPVFVTAIALQMIVFSPFFFGYTGGM